MYAPDIQRSREIGRKSIFFFTTRSPCVSNDLHDRDAIATAAIAFCLDAGVSRAYYSGAGTVRPQNEGVIMSPKITKANTTTRPDPYGRNPPFTVRISDEDLATIRRAAESTGRTVAAYVRFYAIRAATKDLKKDRISA